MANYGRSPHIAIALLFVTLVFSSWAIAAAGEDETAKATRQTLEGGIAAFNKEDLDTTLKTLHSNSPNYKVSKERISRIFHDHDVAMELVEFDYVGETEPYAIARAKVKSTKKSDTKFKNNTTESLYIFKKQDNQWKLWGEYELQTVFDDKQ